MLAHSSIASYMNEGEHEKLNDKVLKVLKIYLQEMVEAVTIVLNNEHLISRTRKLIHLVDLTFLYEDEI